MAISPHPWKWIEPASEEEDYKLVDANGKEIAGFGTSEQYYPTCGSAPGEDDRRVIEQAPRMYAAICKLVVEDGYRGSAIMRKRIAEFLECIEAISLPPLPPEPT